MGHPLSSVIWHVEDGGPIIAKLPNGNKYQIKNAPPELKVGDVITIDSETLEFYDTVTDSGYDVGNLVGVIKDRVDGEIIAEVNGNIWQVRNPKNIDIEVGQTVEIDEAHIIRSRIAEYSITHDLFETDTSGLIDDFRQSLDDEDDKLTFDDFGGKTRQHEHLIKRTKTLLNKREKLVSIGAEIQMGALFYGPPGTGKTHFARILASQLDATFYRVRGPEIVSKMVGDTEQLVRDIFNDAKDRAPSIIFFDEIDSIAADRSGEGRREFSQRLVAQLLSVIDGFDKENHSIFLIAATNQRDNIDEALLRPGRFSWQVEFPEPDEDGLIGIYHSIKDRYDISNEVDEEDIRGLVRQTDNLTGASLNTLLNEAAVLCVESDRVQIEYIDLRKAFERIKEQETRRQ